MKICHILNIVPSMRVVRNEPGNVLFPENDVGKVSPGRNRKIFLYLRILQATNNSWIPLLRTSDLETKGRILQSSPKCKLRRVTIDEFCLLSTLLFVLQEVTNDRSPSRSLSEVELILNKFHRSLALQSSERQLKRQNAAHSQRTGPHNLSWLARNYINVHRASLCPPRYLDNVRRALSSCAKLRRYFTDVGTRYKHLVPAVHRVHNKTCLLSAILR